MPFTEYFVAGDDEAALAGLVPGGPSAAGLPTVFSKNLDPVVTMGTLESILTGRPYDEVVDAPRQGRPVSDPEESPEAFIISITDTLRDALTEAGDAELTEAAVAWAGTEELSGVDPEGLAGFLKLLRDIAQQGRLYCHWAL
jgi:hypothetical protein